MVRLTLSLLGLLLVCARLGYVQSQDDTVGATEPVIFTFADDSTPQSASLAKQNDTFSNIDSPAPALESEEGKPEWTVADESSGDMDSLASESNGNLVGTADDDNTVIPSPTQPAAPEGPSNSTDSKADADGFDMVEGGDDKEFTTEDSDTEETSFAARHSCQTGNPVDDCWRCDRNWASNRQRLASCAVGFGRNAIGGRNGRIYVVTSSRDDNPANPSPGTLRYAVTRPGPLWIIFAYSMTIKLKNELMITSYKTIDGRGVDVHIAGGAGFTLQFISNVIIHGIAIHDIKPTGPARIMTSTSHVGNRGRADGDAISIFTSKNIWVDHCYLARAADGLVDVVRGSTAVSVTNCYFTQHNKVMLLGAHPQDYIDRNMYVTVAYNIFGPGLIQRLPRVRFGNVHVLNNDYTSGWGIYAIAGSEGPRISFPM